MRYGGPMKLKSTLRQQMNQSVEDMRTSCPIPIVQTSETKHGPRTVRLVRVIESIETTQVVRR